MMHIGQGLVCASKIQDLIKAEFHFIIFLADWHSMINNKFGGDLEKIRTVGRYYKHCFTALGVPENKAEYIWASELAERSDYWEKVLRIARATTTQRVLRAIPIMGRHMQSKENDTVIHDETEVIGKKIQQAFCPPKVIDGNPILEYYRILVFENREPLTLKRDPKYGGDLEVPNYEQLERLYSSEKIHPQDLKSNMSRILSQKLEPVREYFKRNPQPLDEVRKLEKS